MREGPSSYMVVINALDLELEVRDYPAPYMVCCVEWMSFRMHTFIDTQEQLRLRLFTQLVRPLVPGAPAKGLVVCGFQH